MSIKWLNRALIVSPYCYALCLTEKVFHRELRRLGIPREDWPPFMLNGASATVHFFEDDDLRVAIVTLQPGSDATPEQVNAILVHEAVHIWQKICEHFNESSPSPEFEAYSIQAISQSLMEAYAAYCKQNQLVR